MKLAELHSYEAQESISFASCSQVLMVRGANYWHSGVVIEMSEVVSAIHHELR